MALENTVSKVELNLPLFNRGKVRDIFDLGDKLMIVVSDRISAFDVVLSQGIPFKGAVLTAISEFWFDKLREIVPNHMITTDISQMGDEAVKNESWLKGRTMLTRKCKILPVECIVRGYISGSGWKDYQKTGSVCGIKLRSGMRQSEKLDEVIFTPSTKAEIGEHDENISFDKAVEIVGGEMMEQVRELSMKLYKTAADFALEKGIIIADTKFEFGLIDGKITLADEALTPDSSRFWPLEGYEPGKAQPSFDKQFIRDWLEGTGWDKTPPPPDLPDEIIEKTSAKYREALQKVAGKTLE